MSKEPTRSTYLLVSQINTLDTWARELINVFPDKFQDYGVYLVGSATRQKHFRDVDIRHIISDKDFAQLQKSIDLGYFNHMMSVWGQQLTGLPIDYQVYGLNSEGNTKYSQKDGHKRHALGILNGFVNGGKRNT